MGQPAGRDSPTPSPRFLGAQVIGGLTTEYCVLETVRDALARGFGTIVLADAIRAVERHPGDGQRAEASMAALGATLVRQQSASAT
jgi:nicotinamidase/pyrazinamidase